MRIFSSVLAVLCVIPVHCLKEEDCPRREPLPGELVLRPNSTLVLGCTGRIKVDGRRIRIASAHPGSILTKAPPHHQTTSTSVHRSHSGTAHSGILNEVEAAGNELSTRGVATVTGEGTGKGAGHKSNGPQQIRQVRSVDSDHKAPFARVGFQPTTADGLLRSHTDDTDSERDFQEEEEEEEEEEEGGRVTRGLRSRPQWRWNETLLVEGEGNIFDGRIVFERGGNTLTIRSVRVADSGIYTCHRQGKLRSALKVTVADPPEDPTLNCFKKSPRSKIICEWASIQPLSLDTQCYLFLTKRRPDQTNRYECSSSPSLSRCWCSVDHDDDSMRRSHDVSLCVTNAAGKIFSSPLVFVPPEIVKPDPPSHLQVQGVEGKPTRLIVNWRMPSSWEHERYYKLCYEIQYHPIHSNLKQTIQENSHSLIITDALAGIQYVIQARAKDEYEGEWSTWSKPVYAHSWTAPIHLLTESDDQSTVTDPFYSEGEGSGNDSYWISKSEVKKEKSLHTIVWISALCALMLIILATYLHWHMGVISKWQGLCVATHWTGSSSPDPVPTPQEGHALVTYAPPRLKESPPNEIEENDEEEKEGDDTEERRGPIHFDNTSYFLVERK